jgi:UDP-N-acetylmuramoylalanine--D-glutamate ligase
VHKRQNKDIAIIGMGKEGNSTYHFLTQQHTISPDNITIRDSNTSLQHPHTSETILGEAYLDNVEAHDIIIRSSGVQPHLPQLKAFKENGGILTSQIEIFFENYQGKVIAVTATKGKTTITQLIYNIMKRAGKNCSLIGNIGIPALTAFDRTNQPEYIVAELSSYMLEDFFPKTEIAILSNLFHEHHSERHGSQFRYFQAKRNIIQDTKHPLIGSQIKTIPDNYLDLKTESRFGQSGKYQYNST